MSFFVLNVSSFILECMYILILLSISVKEHHFLGRGMYERPTDFIKSVLYDFHFLKKIYVSAFSFTQILVPSLCVVVEHLILIY